MIIYFNIEFILVLTVLLPMNKYLHNVNNTTSMDAAVVSLMTLSRDLPTGQHFSWNLTVPTPCISESCIKTKIKILFCGAPKGFRRAFNVFIKLFEAPQKMWKQKSKLIYFLCLRSGREGRSYNKSLNRNQSFKKISTKYAKIIVN